MQNIKHLIIAPHPDDDIIGCSQIFLNNSLSDIVVIYVETPPNLDELPYRTKLALNNDLKHLTSDECWNLYNQALNIYVPDPFYDYHPWHRAIGGFGLYLSNCGYNVWFYTTRMNTPYVKEVPDPEKKKRTLDLLYPYKSDLWKYDARFYLFEGITKY